MRALVNKWRAFRTIRVLIVVVAGASTAAIACRDITRPPALIKPTGKPNLLLNPSGVVAVSPSNMRGWKFYDDQHDTTCTVTSVCRFVTGPATPPIGAGSAELATPAANDGKALLLPDYGGTRFDQITELRYSTYRQSVDAGNNLAIALQFNVDYDLADGATNYQGRIVFEPYQGNGGHVLQNAWQSWDAKAGLWWGTKTSVMKGGVATVNPCIQSSPCTWTQLLTTFPDVGVHATLGAVVLKAGSSWPGFRGNVDSLAIGVNGAVTTFDFELTTAQSVLALPPNQPLSFAPGGIIDGGQVGADSIERGVVQLEFFEGTSQAQRQSAIDAVHGVVIGGQPIIGGDGFYFISIPDDGTAASVASGLATLEAQPQVEVAMPVETHWGTTSGLRPLDGDADYRTWSFDTTANGSKKNWGLERIRAPLAWGCSTGSFSTNVGVVDFGVDTLALDAKGLIDLGSAMPDLANNTAYLSVRGKRDSLSTRQHGRQVSSVLAARGNNGQGMTGVMWTASLIMIDVESDPSHPSQLAPKPSVDFDPVAANLQQNLVNVALHGATIVNLSVNAGYAKGHTPSNGADSAKARRMGSLVSGAIRRLQARGYRPLFVISAGNYGVDAYFGGTNLAEIDFPNQVVTVGASNSANARLNGGRPGEVSNHGARVDLYAPGENVGALDSKGPSTVDHFEGTSAATPIVAGVAGLIASFNSTLSSDQIKQFLLDGAARRGQIITNGDGKLLVDAYEALKMVARQVGGPICGNHIFFDSTAHLVVERRMSSTSFIDDRIPGGDRSVDGPGQATIDNIWHDGHVLNITGGTLKFANGSWSMQPLDTTLSLDHVMSNSNWHLSHDGDSALAYTQVARPGPILNFTLSVASATGLSPIGGPIQGLLTGRMYPLNGPEAVISVSPDFSSNNAEAIIAINLTTGAPRPLFTRPGGSLNTNLLSSEAGDEFIVQYTGPFPTFATCYTEYRSIATGNLIRQIQKPNPNGIDCFGAIGTTEAIALDRRPRNKPSAKVAEPHPTRTRRP